MKKKRVRKNKKVAVRLSENELEAIRRHARYHNQSMSAFILSCVKGRPHIIKVDSHTISLINQCFGVFYDNINDMHMDYARALANLNHDNHLMNSGQLSTLSAKTLTEARNAVIKNEQSLTKIVQTLRRLGASLWR